MVESISNSMMSLLKLFVCILILHFDDTYAVDNLKTRFFQYIMECNRDHPVTSQELDMLRHHKFSDSKGTKCLQACVFKKIKWFNSKGMFDDEVAFKVTQKEVADVEKHDSLKKLYSECKKVNDESYENDVICERASALAKCLTEYSKKEGVPDFM